MIHLSYDEISPFTQKKTVMIEEHPDANDRVKMCMGTGYHTYQSSWVEGSEFIARYEATIPQNIIDTKTVVDGNVWYKMYITHPFATLQPELVDDQWVWAFYMMRSMTADEPYTFSFEEAPDIHRGPDDETRVEYPEADFESAFAHIQAAIRMGVAALETAIENESKGTE